jgi:NAD-dependent deacetylase
MDAQQIKGLLSRILTNDGLVTLLTGAGVSAESGIPTFRGPEGYWTIGSRNYQPHEIATYAMFRQNPVEVWKWYLFRRSVCREAEPNPGHVAISEMETLLGDGFRLLTQNVDGLHLRAGNSLARTYQIHGNLNYMRCAKQCLDAIYPIPDTIPDKKRGCRLSDDELALLACPACGALSRPHVLLWDESYDERFYRFESSMRVAAQTALLMVVGTAGATNLPNRVAAEVLKRGKVIIDINVQRNVFSQVALQSNGGVFWQADSAQALPVITALMRSVKDDHKDKEVYSTSS